LHNLLQGFVFALSAQDFLQVPGFGAAVVVVVVVAVHGGHPAQQRHEHFFDQLSKASAQNDWHSPTCGVVVVVVVTGTGVGAGVGAGVGEGVGAGQSFHIHLFSF